MPPLRRHQLVHLTAAGWQQVLARDWESESRACIEHWAVNNLPLVVTRQRGCRRHPGEPVTLGLAAPARWGRRALLLVVEPRHISWFREFPSLADALGVLPSRDRTALRRLDGSLVQHAVPVHVYGSAGWQLVTGLSYMHDRSDIDLWLSVDGIDQADIAQRLLQRCPTDIRLDGELIFPDGGAVAWREWAAWREQRSTQVLVKYLDGAALDSRPGSQPSAYLSHPS